MHELIYSHLIHDEACSSHGRLRRRRHVASSEKAFRTVEKTIYYLHDGAACCGDAAFLRGLQRGELVADPAASRLCAALLPARRCDVAESRSTTPRSTRDVNLSLCTWRAVPCRNPRTSWGGSIITPLNHRPSTSCNARTANPRPVQVATFPFCDPWQISSSTV